MDYLITFLLLISIGALIVGIIKPSVFSNLLGDWATRKGTAIIFGVVSIILFILMPVSEETSDTEVANDTQKSDNQLKVEIPEYSVLYKSEHISTRMSDDEASYFGDVLIEEDVMDIPPEEFIEIARVIAEREALNYSTSFYSTKEAFEVNMGRIISKENRELFGVETYDANTTFMNQDEMDKLFSQGYIGNLEDNEFRMSFSSAYYELHRGDNNGENDLIVE